MKYFIIALIFGFTFSSNSYASDFYSYLDVRYESGLKKTFLGGPYKGKDWCQKMNQNVWDNVQPICGSCQKELSICTEYSELSVPLRKVMNGEPSPFIYLIATKKNRITFSGAEKSIVEKECEDTAIKFRSNGYPDAKCVR